MFAITHRIDEKDPETDPYDGGDVLSIGYTAATIMELPRGFNIPVSVQLAM